MFTALLFSWFSVSSTSSVMTYRSLSCVGSDNPSEPTTSQCTHWHIKQAFFFALSSQMQSCCATRTHRDGLSAGRWLQSLSAALSIAKPRASVCEIFLHQNSNTIDCWLAISRKENHPCFQLHCNWGEEDSCC